MHGNKTRCADAYCADLARRGALFDDPDARSACDAGAPDAVAAHDLDDALFQSEDVLPQADSQSGEVENRVADRLSGAVEGDVAPAVDVVVLGSFGPQELLSHEQVLRLAALAERVDRRMFDRQEPARIVRGIAPTRREDVEQPLLVLPAVAVGHTPQVDRPNSQHTSQVKN